MKRITAALLLSYSLAGAYASSAYDEPYPNPSLTPGATLAVTQEDICTPGYSKVIRNVPIEVKRRVYESYGVQYIPRTYEVDHLIPLELGGSNSIRNLWPEPFGIEWNAHVKDRLENRLHDLVCDGSLSLDSAQRAISRDWIAAYREYMMSNGRRHRHSRRPRNGYGY